MEYLKHISKRDLISLLAICHEARTVTKPSQLKSCLQKLKTMIYFDGALGVYVDNVNIEGRMSPSYLYHTMDFSGELFQKYINGRYYENSSVCQGIFTNWLPQHWKTSWGNDTFGKGRHSMQLVRSYGYLDGWTTAVYHRSHSTLSALTLAGKKVEKNQRTAAFLRCLSPHFAETLKVLFSSKFIKQKAIIDFKVTKRELEVLKWLAEGKSTWDVSVILNRSESVIKYHVTNLMEKLFAQNRSHAVAIALRQGLID
jgi:LuxR family transcriptional regulator, quorum-sensing system regulator CviR